MNYGHRPTWIGSVGRRAMTGVVAIVAASVSVLAPTTAPAASGSFVTEVAIVARSDDAEQVDQTVDLDSGDLDIGDDGAVGLRFADIHVPPGATITDAYVQFQADEGTWGSASFDIRAEATDDAPTFSLATADITSRPLTAASVTWTPPVWFAAGDAGPDQRTANVASVLDEVVGRPGWAAGNAVVLVITGTGTRVAESSEGSPAGAPTLHVEYQAAAPPTCDYWVSTTGDDGLGSGTASSPWATIGRAAEAVPDAGCTVWVEAGVYAPFEVSRRFINMTTFRSATPHQAVLEGSSTVLDVDGGRNITFEGFELRHSGPGATGYVAIVDRDNGTGVWAESIVLRDNILHDSYDNDLLKVHSGVRNATVENNVFYNQGPNEQHMDVNSVIDVVIQDNLFFNDFARSGRASPGTTKHFIVVKDSGGSDDGQIGSERVTIRRNVFMSFQGGIEAHIQVGNDGKPYFEADDVTVENNLFVGNGSDVTSAPLGVAGARDVSFVNNTVVGDLPSSSYAFRIDQKDFNPVNENLTLANNIWSDPTGTMSDFSNGEPAELNGLNLTTNLYWNAGNAIPAGSAGDMTDDATPVIADPLLEQNQSTLVVPYWTGSGFLSGETTIRAEFVRLVEQYGSIPSSSPANGAAQPGLASATDILGRARSGAPDLGAYEVDGAGAPVAADDAAITDEDTAIPIPVVDNDIDPGGASLNVTGLTQPANGAVVDNGDGTVTYSPDPDWHGADSFTYRATNGTLTSAPATVTVTVNPVNDAPVAADDAFTTTSDVTLTTGDVLANDDDVDGDGLSATGLDTALTAGLVEPAGNGTFTYTPPPGFVGQDSFTYRATDGTLSSAPATVTIDVTDAPPPPPPGDHLALSEATDHGSVTSGDLLATRASDDAYEQVTERVTAGKPSRRTSSLDHRWTFQLSGGPATLLVEAHHTANSEGDHFVFEYSADGQASWAPLVTVTKTADDDQAQLAALPSLSGEVVVRVVDGDNTQGASVADSVFVDHLVIRPGAGPPPAPTVSIEADDPTASEAGDPGRLTITRSTASGTLTVGYTVSGSATPGAGPFEGDYQALGTSVTFADGQLTAEIDVVPFDDAEPEPTETVTVTLGSGTGYAIGTPASATVEITDDDGGGSGPVDHLTQDEATAQGTVAAGDHTATHASDNIHEELVEEPHAGGKRSRLSHEWTFVVAPGTGTLELQVEAHRTGGETFSFDYSTDGSNWSPLITVAKTADDNLAQTALLPDGLSGTVIVRVRDDDRSRSDPGLDSVIVDHLVIRRS